MKNLEGEYIYANFVYFNNELENAANKLNVSVKNDVERESMINNIDEECRFLAEQTSIAVVKNSSFDYTSEITVVKVMEKWGLEIIEYRGKLFISPISQKNKLEKYAIELEKDKKGEYIIPTKEKALYKFMVKACLLEFSIGKDINTLLHLNKADKYGTLLSTTNQWGFNKDFIEIFDLYFASLTEKEGYGVITLAKMVIHKTLKTAKKDLSAEDYVALKRYLNNKLSLLESSIYKNDRISFDD